MADITSNHERLFDLDEGIVLCTGVNNISLKLRPAHRTTSSLKHSLQATGQERSAYEQHIYDKHRPSKAWGFTNIIKALRPC